MNHKKEKSSGTGFGPSKKAGLIFLFGAGLMVLCLWSLAQGMYQMSVGDVAGVLRARLFLFGGVVAPARLFDTIVWGIRVPRVMLAVATGVALATSGAVFQGCFRNPLVEPYILGVSSGAACGAALGIIFPGFLLSVQVLAFAGGAMAVLWAYSIARVRGETPVVTLVLAGIIVGSVFSAFLGILKYMAHDAALREIVFWLMGGFYYACWKDVLVVYPVVGAGFIIVWALGWKLNVLTMGDDQARSLGLDPEKYKLVFMGLATLMTAVSVSSVGVIPWVGLMLPHAARMIIGPDNRFVIILSGVLGALYMVACDTLARTLTQTEIPVGIITSLLGAPYLFCLLRSKGKTAFSG